MRWSHLIAARRPAASRPAATVASAMAAGALVLAGTAGAQALAAPAGAHHLGMYGSWTAAQRAAGYRLLRPTRTYSHVRNGLIGVSRCELKKKGAKHVVSVSYGLTPFSVLSLSQNNSGGPCASTGKVKPLGTYKVDGTTAVLTGKCGLPGLRPCSSRKIFLLLTWRKHGVWYVAGSYGLPRGTLAGFATGLRPVR